MGLYHPRCFVVVFSAVTQPKVVARLLDRLRYLLAKQLTVVGQNDCNYAFTPQFSFGMVTIDPTGADPATVIDQAERIALGADTDVDIEAT